jgi:hypothetical protein
MGARVLPGDRESEADSMKGEARSLALFPASTSPGIHYSRTRGSQPARCTPARPAAANLIGEPGGEIPFPPAFRP